jgi:dTDP-4-amino-4,6-dideoxygalactose transaminase
MEDAMKEYTVTVFGGGCVITQSSELAKEVAAIYQRQGLTCEVIETDKPDTEPKESK